MLCVDIPGPKFLFRAHIRMIPLRMKDNTLPEIFKSFAIEFPSPPLGILHLFLRHQGIFSFLSLYPIRNIIVCFPFCFPYLLFFSTPEFLLFLMYSSPPPFNNLKQLLFLSPPRWPSSASKGAVFFPFSIGELENSALFSYTVSHPPFPVAFSQHRSGNFLFFFPTMLIWPFFSEDLTPPFPCLWRQSLPPLPIQSDPGKRKISPSFRIRLGNLLRSLPKIGEPLPMGYLFPPPFGLTSL